MRYYSYYPGCSAEATAKGLGISAEAIAKPLDMELIELEGWLCCGSTPYGSLDEVESIVVAAHNLALAEKPDVMIVDVMMPKKNGYELIAEVKKELGDKAPISILLTAKGEEADVIKGFSEGADDYIKKPFSPAELIDRVNINLVKRGKSPG